MSGLLFSWLFYSSVFVTGLPRWLTGKESACQCRRHKLDPWGREWQPTPVVLPRKFCGQRSQAGLQYHEVEKETKQQQHFCYWQKVFRMLLKLVIKHCYVYKFSHKSRMVCIFFSSKKKGKIKPYFFLLLFLSACLLLHAPGREGVPRGWADESVLLQLALRDIYSMVSSGLKPPGSWLVCAGRVNTQGKQS